MVKKKAPYFWEGYVRVNFEGLLQLELCGVFWMFLMLQIRVSGWDRQTFQ